MVKINANNLSYDKRLPPFLAALQGQLSGNNRGPDPILAAHRRPEKRRSASEEVECAPVVLDERGDVVTGVAFGQDGVVSNMTARGALAEEEDTREHARNVSTAHDAPNRVNIGIAAGKKRRVGKSIGIDEEEYRSGDNEGEEDDNLRRKRCVQAKSKRDTTKRRKNKDSSYKSSRDLTEPTKKQVPRKIKFSFEAEEEV